MQMQLHGVNAERRPGMFRTTRSTRRMTDQDGRTLKEHTEVYGVDEGEVQDKKNLTFQYCES